MAEEALKITITADNKQALAAMNQTVTSLDNVSSAAGATGGKVVKMGKDFTGLSRVIQDLPYGFNAISNNLTQLVPAAGAAGLAFSALVAGLSFAQIGLSNWTRGAQAANEGMKESTKALTDFYTELQGAKNVIKQAEAGVITKKQALDKYNDTLGSTIGYAKSLSEAEALMEANTANVVKSIMLKAQAQVMYAKAANESAKIATGEVFDMTLIDQATTGIKAFVQGGIGAIGGVAGKEMVARLAEAKKNAALLTAEGDKLTRQAIEYDQALKGNRTAPGKGGGSGKPADSVKEVNAALEAQIAIFLRLRDARIKAQGQGALGTIMPERDKAKDLTNLKLTTDGNAALNQVLLRQSELQDQRNQNLAIANGLTDMAMNSISGLVNAMANGQNIGQALGDMFKRLAIDIALAAAKAMIFQAILGAINPTSALGKSGFFKGFTKLLGFSEGGTVSGPKSGYPVMLHGTEHIVRPDQMRSIIASASQMGGGNSRVIVEGRIRGNDIFLSQQRTGQFRSLTT